MKKLIEKPSCTFDYPKQRTVLDSATQKKILAIAKVILNHQGDKPNIIFDNTGFGLRVATHISFEYLDIAFTRRNCKPLRCKSSQCISENHIGVLFCSELVQMDRVLKFHLMSGDVFFASNKTRKGKSFDSVKSSGKYAVIKLMTVLNKMISSKVQPYNISSACLEEIKTLLKT